MNKAPNFSSILDDAPTEVDRPKSLPTGTYEFVVGRWEEGVSSQKKTPFVRFQMRPTGTMDDVDEDELAEALTSADGTSVDLGAKGMSITFYVTATAVYRLDEFHQQCGLDLSNPLSRKARNDEVLNASILGYVAPRESNNPDAPIFMEIKRTLPAE